MFKLPCPLDAPALPEELEHVALVRLIPRNLHGGNRADVQAVNLWISHHLLDEFRVLGDDRTRERITDLFEHVALGSLHHTGVRTEKLPVRQRMRKRIALHDGRPYKCPAVERYFA